MPHLSSLIGSDVSDGSCCTGCGWLSSRWPALRSNVGEMNVCSTKNMVTAISNMQHTFRRIIIGPARDTVQQVPAYDHFNL